MKILSRGLPAAVLALALVLALVPAAASAAPVTVDLRVEGKSQTLYEGPVTTDARMITAPSNKEPMAPAPRPCNYRDNANYGFGPEYGTPTTALYDAARASALAFEATWYPDFNDLLVTRVGPDANGGAPSYESWGFAVNSTAAAVGGCQIALGVGNDVLWAYDLANKAHMLRLSGPTSVTAGQSATYTVTDGRTGEPLSGATVAGSSTDSKGQVTLTFNEPGTQRLKAERSDSVRSNAVRVEVRAAAAPDPQPVVVDTRDRTAPLARVKSPRHRVTYRARFAPRVIRGEVEELESGVLSVKLRLTRRVGKRCWSFSGTRERFIRVRCGRGFYFTVTKQASFDFLLPKRLRRGSYVVDVKAIDRAYNRDDVRSKGRNRAEFRVR